ncbi:MAG: HDOD domain-containing protein [Thiotrichaceae bacterium]|nr:HDOD domain-containing protein [Thiotrichaceae bacterium]PCI15075.1 MAG: diguanylate phosphodiesterase [Thiotrichales bacterium]
MPGQIYVARQPIFDRNGQVYAYELLYRSSLENYFSHHHDGDEASSSVINNSMFGFGLENLTGGKTAFINLTRTVLLKEWITLIPKELVAAEVLETIEPDEAVIEACRKLKKSGYMVVLDDFVYDAKFEPLLALADIVKIDFIVSSKEERAAMCQRFADKPFLLLAEKVENHEEYQEALALGFTYFQGYFFCKPEVVTRKDIPGFKLNYLRFLKELNRPDLDYANMEAIIKHDIALSYKLLRYINSVAFGWRRKVETIKQALVMLGERPLKKWASLAAFSSIAEDKPPELLITSLVRASFCELIAADVGMKGKELDLFFIGMLSVVDALVDRPIEEILDEIGISDEVKEALVDGGTPAANVLQLIVAYQQADWEQVAEMVALLEVDEARVPELYYEAIAWADEVGLPESIK